MNTYIKPQEQVTLAVILVVCILPMLQQALQMIDRSSMRTYQFSIEMNHAAAGEYEVLPGIGTGIAEKIVEYQQNTPFTAAEDLKKVKGIGEKRYQAVKPYLTEPHHQ